MTLKVNRKEKTLGFSRGRRRSDETFYTLKREPPLRSRESHCQLCPGCSVHALCFRNPWHSKAWRTRYNFQRCPWACV